jgi:hypothetical protein
MMLLVAGLLLLVRRVARGIPLPFVASRVRITSLYLLLSHADSKQLRMTLVTGRSLFLGIHGPTGLAPKTGGSLICCTALRFDDILNPWQALFLVVETVYEYRW